MNILHTETLKRWGGQQNRVFGELIRLKDRGHKMVLACNRDSVIGRNSKDAGIKVYELNFKKSTYWRTIPLLMKIIKSEDISIVSTHSSTDSWAAGIAARLTGRRLVRFKHNMFPIGRDPLTWFIYSIPDRFIVVSEPIKEMLKSYGISDEKIRVIHTSVDCKRFVTEKTTDLRGELAIPEDVFVIGNNSGSTKHKAPHVLFKAFDLISKRYRTILLLTGGYSREKKERLLSIIDEGIRERVVFLGYRTEIPSVLRSTDVYVSSSVSEGLSISVIEAMAMALPVIVSDIPAFRSFIKDGHNGLIFRSEEPDDLARKISLVIENESLRMQIGKNARRTVLERFNIEKMVEDTEKTYMELLGV